MADPDIDPDAALAALLNAIDTQDIEKYWAALDDLLSASTKTGKLPRIPRVTPNALEVLFAAAHAQAERLGELIEEAKAEGNTEAAAEDSKSLEELEAVLNGPLFTTPQPPA